MRGWRITATVFCVLAVSVLVGLICGLRPFIVRSDSMSPEYKDGDLVVADSHRGLTTLQEGDVIVVRGSGYLELMRYQGERIARVDNGKDEKTISEANLVGGMVFSIPWIGNVVNGILEQRIVVWVLIAALVIYAMFPRKLLQHLPHRKEGGIQ